MVCEIPQVEGRYRAVVFLRDDVDGSSTLLPHAKGFPRYSGAKKWALMVIARKKRATRYWMIDEWIDGAWSTDAGGNVSDQVPYSADEQRRFDLLHVAARRTSHLVFLPGELLDFLQLHARRQGLSVSDVLAKAAAEFLSRHVASIV